MKEWEERMRKLQHTEQDVIQCLAELDRVREVLKAITELDKALKKISHRGDR